MDIRVERFTKTNFNEYSLDDFIRHQVVTECWRNVDGEWKLLPIAFVENWDVEKCRENAIELYDALEGMRIGFGAFDGNRVVGYASISTSKMGIREQYVQLIEFQVSEDYRGKKIGRNLFEKCCEAARTLGAEKIYISAHSSKESQAAYRALGCVYAKEPDQKLVELEPYDVQLEYCL